MRIERTGGLRAYPISTLKEIIMQFIRATNTAALFLLFGTIIPAYAQHDQQSEKQGKPEKQQGEQRRPAPPPSQQQRSQPQRTQQTRQQQPQTQRTQQSQRQQPHP